MKCPKCNNDVMMVLCRRDPRSGFLNELYYKCLACGFTSQEDFQVPETRKAYKRHILPPKFSARNLRWKAATVAVLTMLTLVSIMQIPVPVKVFATEVSLDPVKDILPYIRLVNFTISDFSLNYTEGEMLLRVSADYSSVTAVEDEANITTCVMSLSKVLVSYQDSNRAFNMGFASLTMTIKIMYEELIAKIEASAYMPLWTEILQKLTGQPP
jgi:hypothetical protein